MGLFGIGSKKPPELEAKFKRITNERNLMQRILADLVRLRDVIMRMRSRT